jgi:Tol biopolymer transport system component/predicted Ser/Thr protein kinase
VVSHYRVLKELGRGGMGIVYQAEDVRLGRPVALKFLAPGSDSDSAAVSRFEREARTASSLNHPGICTIYEVGIHNGRTFIAMELLEGETLRDRLVGQHAFPRFSAGELLDLAIPVADALEAAHERGIIHRDIKPANIFLTLRREVKILDFGLAKPAPRRIAAFPRASGSDSDSLTRTGATPGTPLYMSPEQARAEDLDGRSDLYSYGLVLYEMATGQRSVSPGTEPAHLLQSAAPHLPLKLSEIVSRLLEPDRSMRYQSAADVASDLKRLKRDLLTTPATPPPLAAAAPAVAPPPMRSTSPWRVPAILLVSTVVLIAAIWRLFPSPRLDAPLIADHLTSDPGFHVAAEFSPDGKQIAYCWNGYQENNYDIYVLTLGSNEPRRLTTSPAVEYSPAWSPDGRSIAYLAGPEDGVATLMVVPAAGGPARKVSDTSMRVAPHYRRLDWSRDGRWLIMERESRPEEGYPLSVVSVETGESRKLTDPSSNQADLQPAVSPDGRTLAYVRDVGNGVSLPFLLPVSSAMAPGEPRHLPLAGFQNVSVTYPSWWSGRNLVFVSNRGGPTRLWRTSVDGRSAPVLLAALGEGVGFPAISPDGRRLVFSRFTGGGSVWSAGTDPSGPAPSRVTSSAESDATPDFSPDGSQITFDSTRSGSSEIWVAGRNGEAARQLTHYHGPGTGSPRWSPDGKWIVYDSRLEGQPDLYMVPASGGEHVRLTKDPAADVSPIWSPDGRWIYFCSGRSGGRQVWRIPAGGGPAEQITRFGGCHPHPSPDGKTLYYSKQAGVPTSSIWKVPADGGEELLVVSNALDRCFALSRSRLYYAARQSGEPFPTLYYLDLVSNRTVMIRRLNEPLSAGFVVSPEGDTILFHLIDRRGSNLMLVNDLH